MLAFLKVADKTTKFSKFFENLQKMNLGALPEQNRSEKLDSEKQRTWLPPWNVSSSRKAKTHFLKKQRILYPTLKWQHIWILKYEYTVAKSKNQ